MVRVTNHEFTQSIQKIIFIFYFKQPLIEEDIFKYQRKPYIETGEIYFWTATLNKSTRYYERNEKEFPFLKDLMEEF